MHLIMHSFLTPNRAYNTPFRSNLTYLLNTSLTLSDTSFFVLAHLCHIYPGPHSKALNNLATLYPARFSDPQSVTLHITSLSRLYYSLLLISSVHFSELLNSSQSLRASTAAFAVHLKTVYDWWRAIDDVCNTVRYWTQGLANYTRWSVNDCGIGYWCWCGSRNWLMAVIDGDNW